MHEHTFAEYLRLEKDSNLKHELLDGEIYAMTGGSPKHAKLAVAFSTLLHNQLRGSEWQVFSSHLRIRVPATGLAAYPDVTVVCGELTFDPEDDDTVTNPRVVVEVLSPSTEKFDRGLKLQHTSRFRRSQRSCWSRNASRRSRCAHAATTAPGRSVRVDRARPRIST